MGFYPLLCYADCNICSKNVANAMNSTALAGFEQFPLKF